MESNSSHIKWFHNTILSLLLTYYVIYYTATLFGVNQMIYPNLEESRNMFIKISMINFFMYFYFIYYFIETSREKKLLLLVPLIVILCCILVHLLTAFIMSQGGMFGPA
jgi:hypothetical protein